MSVEDAKRELLSDAGDEEAGEPGIRGWIVHHPGEAMLAAACVGLVLVAFPRVRRLAVPLAIALARRAWL